MAAQVTLAEVEAALDSVPATDGVTVVQVREDGSLRKLADRDGVPHSPGHLIVLNSRTEAAAIFKRARKAVSTASEAEEPPAPGDQPPTDAPPRGPGE